MWSGTLGCGAMEQARIVGWRSCCRGRQAVYGVGRWQLQGAGKEPRTSRCFFAEPRVRSSAVRAGPDDPPLSPEQTALLTAGELLAFLRGRRGVAVLQLFKGWGEAGPEMQPLLRPFVLGLLCSAAEDKGAALLPSPAPGGLGASLLLAAKAQPFKARAEHLARIGVQVRARLVFG